jgi:autotransporter-associated beta strand protein
VNQNVTFTWNVSKGTVFNGVDLDVYAEVFGPGGLIKTGAGTMRLWGSNNSWSGGLTVSAGTVLLGSNTAAGTGTLTLDSGTIQADGAARSIANPINITNVYASTISGQQDLTLTGAITGTGGGLYKSGSGTLVLSGSAPSTSSGWTSVVGGTLALGRSTATGCIVGSELDIGFPGPDSATVQELASNQIGDTTEVTIGSGGLLRLNDGVSDFLYATDFDSGSLVTGTSPSSFISMGWVSVGSLLRTASVSGRVNQFVSGYTWNVVGYSSYPIDFDVPAEIFGPGSVNKTGAGTMRLSGNNASWSGGLIVSGGTVLFGSNTAAGTGTLTLNGGTIQADGAARSLVNAVNITAPSTVSGSQELTLNGQISGSGRLFKTGSGTLYLIGPKLNTGGITVTGGRLVIDSGASLGAFPTSVFPDSLVLDGGTLQLGLGGPSAPMVPNQGVTLGAGGGTIDTLLSDANILGNVTGPGSLIKNGSHDLLLESSNTYTGNTTINEGILFAATMTGNVTVASGARFDLGSYVASITYGGTISGGGSVVFGELDSQVTVTSNSAYMGGTAIYGGFLQLGNGGTSGSIIGDVYNIATLIFNRSDDVLFAGGISGSGALVKNGSGSLTLTGANTYTGPTTVLQGKLVLGSTLTGTSSVVVNDGATLELKSGAGVVLKTASLVVNGTGRLDLRDNKLIVPGTDPGTWSGSNYTGLTGLIASGRGSTSQPLRWLGSGIVTSMTAATTGNYTSIGIASGHDARGIAGFATALWAGTVVFGHDTLVMYTYGGDANLDGKINIDDYIRIDMGREGNASGWSNGDFDYDGKVNIDDYLIIDSNIGSQGAPFSTASGLDHLTAVPEPAAGFMMTSAAAALLTLRRRKTCT